MESGFSRSKATPKWVNVCINVYNNSRGIYNVSYLLDFIQDILILNFNCRKCEQNCLFGIFKFVISFAICFKSRFKGKHRNWNKEANEIGKNTKLCCYISHAHLIHATTTIPQNHLWDHRQSINHYLFHYNLTR